MNFGDFFKAASGLEPFDYQCRLAAGAACESRLINTSIGQGKTTPRFRA